MAGYCSTRLRRQFVHSSLVKTSCSGCQPTAPSTVSGLLFPHSQVFPRSREHLDGTQVDGLLGTKWDVVMTKGLQGEDVLSSCRDGAAMPLLYVKYDSGVKVVGKLYALEHIHPRLEQGVGSHCARFLVSASGGEGLRSCRGKRRSQDGQRALVRPFLANKINLNDTLIDWSRHHHQSRMNEVQREFAGSPRLASLAPRRNCDGTWRHQGTESDISIHDRDSEDASTKVAARSNVIDA